MRHHQKILITDLTPYFADPCRLFVLLARNANVGVIFRRGPTKLWRITLWDTKRDGFEGGQWFRGQMYPEKCDLSPDGKLLIYFAGKFKRPELTAGYGSTWTAVSRPPYLTALALWPIDDTYAGQGVFLDNNTVLIATSSPFGAKHHPDHPSGPLKVLAYSELSKNDPRLAMVPCWMNGWVETRTPGKRITWRKTTGDLILERDGQLGASISRTQYRIYRADGELVASFEAHWADWDQQGRLVATVGGHVFGGELLNKRKLRWHQLAALQDGQFTAMEAPSWAQHW